MALIRHGSIEDFVANVPQKSLVAQPSLAGLQTFSAIQEATREVQPVEVEFGVSAERRGLTIKSIKLTEDFDGFLNGIFGSTNNVYIVSWAWDYSGKPPVEYPGQSASLRDCLIPVTVGKVREFMGSGIALFPARVVTAGLAVRIMLWESDAKERNFGKALADVSTTIKTSNLTNLLALLAAGTGIPGALVTMTAAASVELAGAIGNILQANSDDYVDFYEGYYPANKPWSSGVESYSGHASAIQLERLT